MQEAQRVLRNGVGPIAQLRIDGRKRTESAFEIDLERGHETRHSPGVPQACTSVEGVDNEPVTIARARSEVRRRNVGLREEFETLFRKQSPRSGRAPIYQHLN